jgi:hypothetical protein
LLNRKILPALAVVLALVPAAVAAEFTVTAGFVVVPTAEPAPAPKPKAARYVPDIPGRKYDGAKFTQSISVLNDRDRIEPAPILKMPDRRWHQPGGMEGVTGWRSERFRFLPDGHRVRAWIGNVEVENSIRTGRLKADGTPEHFKQHNRALLRSYPDGTRFDELLVNADTGDVFEHRVRLKKDGKWLSEVYHKDEGAFPKGYSGLTASCSSCHAEAGTGKYDAGLVPGGDTVLSDPLPWELWFAQPPEGAAVEKRHAPAMPFGPLVLAPSFAPYCPTGRG